MKASEFLDEKSDFSLVLGGPLYQLFRKSHLSGDGLELLKRRLLVLTLLSWVPLLLLTAPTSPSERLSFYRDIEVHIRFLVALPVLIGAELIVHSRVRRCVRSFLDRRIIVAEDRHSFDDAIQSAVRLRNSVSVEVGLLLVVYTIGLWLWHARIQIATPTWYITTRGRWDLTPAGYWYVFFSIPVLQFLLLRWYFRLFIWFRFLWHVSRLNLNLLPSHPDRAAGLAFLGRSAYAFGPILFAQGAMLAGLIASRVLYNGESLLHFKLQAAGFICFFVFVILIPLVMFTPRLGRAKRQGLAEYGLLSQRYVEAFQQKWVCSPHSASEELLGSGDIQSLADLGNSYALVRDMRIVPFGLQDISRLAAATAAPLAPLLLTLFSPEELLSRIVKVIF